MNTKHASTSKQTCLKHGLEMCASFLFMACLFFALPTAKAASPSDSSASAGAATSSASSKPAAPANYVSGAPTYTAKKAITLDGLMKEVYPSSPLQASILNKALVSANPKLLTGKTNQSIKRGATLNIPNHTQLIVETLAPYAPPPPPMAVAPPPDANQYGSQSSDPSSRRHWVRFP
jgi:Tfp pilus assembly protein FimV